MATRMEKVCKMTPEGEFFDEIFISLMNESGKAAEERAEND